VSAQITEQVEDQHRSGHESILHALQPIARRLWWRALRDHIATGVCIALAAAIGFQLLRLISPANVALWRVLLAIGVLAAIAWVAWQGRRQLNLARAASEADERANLKDELKSAYWFLGRDERSPLIEVLLQRACGTAKGLIAPQVVPGVAPKRVALLISLAVVTGALAWWSPRLAHSSLGRALAGGAGDAQASTPGATGKDAQGAAAARALQEEKEKAAAAQAAAQASAQQRAAALAQAQSAAASAMAKSGGETPDWAKLESALARLKGQDADGALAAAIKARDAQRVAKLLEALARKQELAQADPAVQPQLSIPFTDRGEGFIPKLQDLFEQQDDPFKDPEALAEEAAQEELRKAAEAVTKLDENSQSPQRKQLRHEEAYSASIGRDSVIEASRYGERDPNEKTEQQTGSSQTGETQMQGGMMHRRAAMTRGDPNQDGGSRVGEAEGDAKADPMIGKKTARLNAQLRRVDIEAKKQDEQGEGDPDKFFAATRQQESKLAYTDVARRARYVTEEATSGEQVPLTYRGVVKDYFINLRQKEK
jgi:hypothetical protein